MLKDKMSNKELIEVRTGSDSDIPKIEKAYRLLEFLGIPYSARILSAHRTHRAMAEEAEKLFEKGFHVSIAAAGGSAHLPGMSASKTVVPVVALPVYTSSLCGEDSLHSMIQMPNGIPVGTVGIGQAEGAALLAAQIAYLDNPEVRNRIRAYKGLEGEVSQELTPTVGIVKLGETESIVEEIYSKMLPLIESFGLEIKEYPYSFESMERAKVNADYMKDESIVALIVPGYKSAIKIPQRIARSTDIPTLGLPIAEGFAGAGFQGSQQGIFGEMFSSERGVMDSSLAGIGINRCVNAVLYAVQIAGVHFPELYSAVEAYRNNLAAEVKAKDAQIQTKGIEPFLN